MREELDSYRNMYDLLVFREHKEMYERIGEVYPEQAFWNAPDCAAFLERYQPERVVELGGHDGGLAAAVLPGAPFVSEWLNFELVDCDQTCADYRYSFVVLGDWLTEVKADALVLSHVLEHLSEFQARRLIAGVDARAIYVDAPLLESQRSEWRGTMTAHVLPHSFTEVDALFAEHGWSVAHAAAANLHGFESRTRWYER